MTVQTPDLAIIPVLNEEQMALFLRLAMEMAKVIQGDEGGESRTEEEKQANNNAAQQIA